MRRLAPLALVLLAAVRPAAAQVGHDPHTSPFRSIDRSTWLEAYAGMMFGNGGPIPVGPRDGTLGGARISFRGKNALQISVGTWVAAAKRNVIDANDSIAKRVTGPYNTTVVGFEGTLQFNVTGGKTWHKLAPYTSLSFGFATSQGVARDTSGYRFGTKTYFAPAIGTRLFLGERITLRAEARSTIWQIKYPISYSYEPTKQPGTIESPNAVNPGGRSGDYTLVPKLILGLGWAF